MGAATASTAAPKFQLATVYALSRGFSVLLGIAAELVGAPLRAKVIIGAVVIYLGSGLLLVNLHVTNRIPLHSILRNVRTGAVEQMAACGERN